MSDKQSQQVQQQLNSIIRAGLDIDDLTMDALAFANQIDVNVLRLWSLVKSIKDDMLFLMRNNGPKAYIGRQCVAKVMSKSMSLVCSSMSTESNSLTQTSTMVGLPVPVDLVAHIPL